MSPNEPILKQLDPPTGGLEGLRGRIRRRQHRQTAITALAVAGLALGWFGSIEKAPEQGLVLAENHPYTRLAQAEPAEPVRIIGGAAIEWPSTQPKTRIYLVDSAPPIQEPRRSNDLL
jgi:hypothetical protein